MKKMLLLVTVLLTTVVAQAQVLHAAPQGQVSQPSTSSFKTTIAPTENQMWWGYFSETDFELAESKVGIGKPTSFNAAIFVPANHEQIGKSTVKAVRIYIAEGVASSYSGLKVWISKALPETADDADYVQPVTESLTSGANDFELNTPYEVNGGAFYVGYSFTSSDSHPVWSGGLDTPNAFLLSVPGSIEWDDLNGYGFGKLAFQILVEGAIVAENSVSIADFEPIVAGTNQILNVPVMITNEGVNVINNFSYTVSVNGTTSEENTYTMEDLPFNGTRKVNLAITTVPEEGEFTYTITITKVNGNPNNSNQPSATGSITTNANLKTFPRNVLIEEFTTESCGYCPEAAAGLSSFMTSNPELAERVAVVCHHAGFGTDWLTVKASEQYTWFYNDGGSTYAPAFMYDRYAWDGRTPVVSRGYYKDYVEARMLEVSYANIDLTANLGADAINVTAECERYGSTQARITLFLTEDNIKAKNQSGGGSSFVHQHVLRAVNSTWGSVLSWSDNKSTYTYTFQLDTAWKTEDLKVVAMISGYHRNDPTKCVVENAAVTVPGTETGIEGHSVVNLREARRYSLDGRQMSAPQRGLNIVRMSDGSFKKVVVK